MLNSPLRIYWASRIFAAMSATTAPVVLTMGTLSSQAGMNYLSAMLSAQAIGQIAAMAVSGPLIDRCNRKAFLIIVQLLTSVTWALFAFLLSSSSSSQVLWVICAALLGSLGGLNGPATQSLLSWLVPKENMQEVIAKLRITLNTVALLFPALGGLALGFVPGNYVALALALFMFLSSLTLFGLPNIFKNSSAASLKSSWKDALQPWFLGIIIVTGVMNLLWAGFFQLNGPKILSLSSSQGALHWGLISTALAAGLIFGGLYYKGVDFRRPLSTSLLLLAPKAVPVLLVALLIDWYWIALAVFIAGFFLEAFAVNFYTQVQLRIPQRSLGTALSLDGFIGLGLMPLGYAFAEGTFQGQQVDLAGIIAAAATLLLVLAGWLLVRCTRWAREPEQDPQPVA